MSSSAEEYLEALYTLTQDSNSAGTSEISKRLKIAPASVTEMLRKLAAKGYINYSPYHGATLTQKGLQIASKITRKHRLLERFLHDVLKISKERVHQEACEMEHALSDETERAMCLNLNSPNKCPDDKKVIPACQLNFKNCDECRKFNEKFENIDTRKILLISLTAMKEKQQGTIAFIRGNNKILYRLMEMGLIPGTTVSIKGITPLKGPVEVAINGAKLALGEEIACNVFVEGL